MLGSLRMRHAQVISVSDKYDQLGALNIERPQLISLRGRLEGEMRRRKIASQSETLVSSLS
jgi:hypothetical protein